MGNVRAALDWALSPQGDAALGADLAIAAVPLWMQPSLMEECRMRIDAARRQQALSWELRAATSLARLERSTRDLLAGVYRRFCEGFATADLLVAKALLDAPVA